MNKLNNYKKRLPRLEILLPLVYICIAALILLYQKLVPDYTPGYDVMTGAIHIRNSDLILAFLSGPTIIFWTFLTFIFGRNTIENNTTINLLLLIVPTGDGWKSSLTEIFFINPLGYFAIILLAKKIIILKNKIKEKARRYVRTNRA